MRISCNTLSSLNWPWPGAVLLFLFSMGLSGQLAAQSRQSAQRFKAGVIFGVTASQIDGDISAGYHKVGLQGGLRGIVSLTQKQDASIELFFTQRGCRNQPKTFPEFNVTLNYIEVPVQWHYHDWAVNDESDDPEYYRVHLNLGLSYARLLDYKDKYELTALSLALPELNRNSVCVLVGASFFASKHLAFTFRYHRALNRLYRPDANGGGYDRSLNEHFLAFQTMYVF